MSFWIAGAIVATTTVTQVQARKEQKKAKKQAEKDALEAEKQARKSEVFAETEGEGVGSLGKISLEVDDELDEDLEVSSGNVRI
jgi:hypothetical protein